MQMLVAPGETLRYRVRHSCADAVVELDRELLDLALSQALAGGADQDLEVGVRTANGRYRSCHIAAVRPPAPARGGLELPGASVGFAHGGGRNLTADQLGAEADASMYSDKHARDRREKSDLTPVA